MYLHGVLSALFRALYDIFGDCRSYLMRLCKRWFGRYPICAPVVSFYLGAIVFNALGLSDIIFVVVGVQFQRNDLGVPFSIPIAKASSFFAYRMLCLIGLDYVTLLLHIHLRALPPLGRSNVLSRSKISLGLLG